MKRSKKLALLLGVLVLVSLAAFAALRHEERVEQIKNSDEIVLELPTDTIQAVTWEQNGTTLAFHRDGQWRWDEDDAFPVDDEKIDGILERFASFGVSFVIEDVEDYAQYGLDDPVCTIGLTTEDQSYTVTLGSFSNMDQQRYVSLGDGNVYLVQDDPMNDFEAELSDFIRNDTTPDFDRVTGIQFTGAESYAVTYASDSPDTYCADDVYFTERDGKNLPLDTARITTYLQRISSLDLTDYATYNATAEELESYGLTDPELTATVDYITEDEDGNETPETITLHVSRNPEEQAAAEQAEADGEETIPEVTGYARVGDSQIVYRIPAADCEALLACGYDSLRHREVLTADFADVTQLDVSLEGTDYTLTAQGEDEDRTWSYQGEEQDISGLQSALESLTADSFTDEQPTGKEEISLTVHLDNENFPEVSIALYRYDGASCLAMVDGEPVSLVPRSGVVDLMEAVNGIVLQHAN